MTSILNMAQTTKALRTLLMSKAWSSVWRAVLANDPDAFPPKPDDMNEPQYVALICGLYCFVRLYRSTTGKLTLDTEMR